MVVGANESVGKGIDGVLEQALDNQNNKLQKIIEAVERLEKAGTLAKLIENAQYRQEDLWKLQLPCVSSTNGYKEIRDDVLLTIAFRIENINKEVSIIKAALEHVDSLYNSWKGQEITNPDILKFVKDYEEDHKKNEEEKK